MTDLRGKIIFKIRGWRLQLLSYFSTLWMTAGLSIRKIKYGKGLRFWGISFAVRFPGSAISIGNGCSFRSHEISNLIGLNRKCMLSTHSAAAVLIIGNNCGFSGTVIGCKERIVLGNDVLCGANTLITDFDWHGVAPDKRRSSTGDSKAITIGNNVFLGQGTIVLKGVSIGDNSVIGANSVVTKSIPANVIAGGNPCRVIKEL